METIELTPTEQAFKAESDKIFDDKLKELDAMEQKVHDMYKEKGWDLPMAQIPIEEEPAVNAELTKDFND